MRLTIGRSLAGTFSRNVQSIVTLFRAMTTNPQARDRRVSSPNTCTALSLVYSASKSANSSCYSPSYSPRALAACISFASSFNSMITCDTSLSLGSASGIGSGSEAQRRRYGAGFGGCSRTTRVGVCVFSTGGGIVSHAARDKAMDEQVRWVTKAEAARELKMSLSTLDRKIRRRRSWFAWRDVGATCY